MVLITWDEPGSGEDVHKVEIHRSTTESGTYSLIETIDAKDGDSNWVTQYDDTTGSATDWYKLRFQNTAATQGPFSEAKEVEYSRLTYTTIALVKSQVKSVTPSITDPEIGKAILDAESFIDSFIKDSLKGSFDTTKLGVIRTLCTKLAVTYCLEDDVVNQLGSSVGSLLLEAIKNDISTILSLLSDQRYIEYLKGL